MLRQLVRRGTTQEEDVKQVLGRCPVCGGELSVTKLECSECDTTLQGHFRLGRFYHLRPEQLQFAETFIKCEGKINRVEEELGISYPTVRSRLEELIRALGYQVEEQKPGRPSPAQRMAILDRLASGELTTDEAARLLKGQTEQV